MLSAVSQEPVPPDASRPGTAGIPCSGKPPANIGWMRARKVVFLALSHKPLVLRPGDRVVPVGQVQEQLNTVINADLIVDNTFGPATEASLREFQRLARLPETGIVDQATWYRLFTGIRCRRRRPSARSPRSTPKRNRRRSPRRCRPRTSTA